MHIIDRKLALSHQCPYPENRNNRKSYKFQKRAEACCHNRKRKAHKVQARHNTVKAYRLFIMLNISLRKIHSIKPRFVKVALNVLNHSSDFINGN